MESGIARQINIGSNNVYGGGGNSGQTATEGTHCRLTRLQLEAAYNPNILSLCSRGAIPHQHLREEVNTMTEPAIPHLEILPHPVNLRRGVKDTGQGHLPLEPVTDDAAVPNAAEGQLDDEAADEQQDIETEYVSEEDVSDSEPINSDVDRYIIREVEECIEYTRRWLSQVPPRTALDYRNFATHAGEHPSQACQMLRKAAQAGLAQFARGTDQEEVYTVGRPPPVAPIGFGEHWWAGLTRAQIRAGPTADDRQVRRAENDLERKEKRQQEARRKGNGRLNIQLRVIEEGLRRQEQGIRMNGSDVDGEDVDGCGTVAEQSSEMRGPAIEAEVALAITSRSSGVISVLAQGLGTLNALRVSVMRIHTSVLVVYATLGFASPTRYSSAAVPTAQTCNGTYTGVYSPSYDQDFFLGVPYAQPPVGDLRFRNPRSLTGSWNGSHKADTYSPACVGYGPSQSGYNVSEDCLYLNVIRPAGAAAGSKLPVAVWIHGGGWVQGSGVDLRYNMSFIVEQSQAMGQPIIAVTLNYRLSAWGFLQGYEDARNGSLSDNGANWGDPDQVTIWGQSAGAASVGVHLIAFNGRDDSLFRSAILESGNPIIVGATNRPFEQSFQNLTNAAGCSNATDALGCLRELPFSQLNAVVNTTQFSGIWSPQIDGDIIARYSSEQVAEGAFVRVPIIIGANSDEGTSFAPKGLNTSEQFLQTLTSGSSPMNLTTAQSILDAYPLQSPELDLANLGPPDFVPPAYPYGLQYRRTTSYYTDQTFVANRRLTCQSWANYSLDAYCYRFNAIPAWAGPYDGATHFVEVAFAMKNLDGVGYAPVRTPPFQGIPQSYRDLAGLMAGDWVSFVATGDPNKWNRADALRGLQTEVPAWAAYEDATPKIFVYEGNATNTMEDDTWRAQGIDIINSLNKEVYGR
ncbi:hypothetical protein OPT61_g5635 [Boeremia exigua]|uniref:Uncharacterized protein n=1 Tax=Boeremia exigua TaxID=749465 RepID=A0ACC2I9R1_9PLEO|nr:hypothetical protein OPT61_g5635 [Boeremia exigua]